MPLHKLNDLSLYYQQLSQCIIHFIEKDSNLTELVFKSFLRFWPKTDSRKEIIFLLEVKDTCSIIDPLEFQKVMVPLFHQIAKCANSQNSKVAETVFGYWKNDYIMSLIAENAKVILPILFPPIHINSKFHWNKTVRNASCKALKKLSVINQQIFFECQQQFEQQQKMQVQLYVLGSIIEEVEPFDFFVGESIMRYSLRLCINRWKVLPLL